MRGETEQLSLLCLFIKRGITPEYVEEDGITVINQKCVREGRVSLNPARLTHKNTKIKQEKLLQEGDILVNSTGTGTLGRTAYFSFNNEIEKAIVDTHITVVRPNRDKINPLFLAYVLSQMEPVIVNMAKGTTNQVELSASDLSLLPIPLRLRPIQDKISQIIKNYDDLIENNGRRILLLEQSTHLLYREWFVHLRFPGHEHVKITNKVPEGWETITVPDIIDINPNESVPKNSDICYVPMSSLSEYGMTVNVSDLEKRQKATSVKFRNGDTLLARITPCLENGKTGFVNFLKENEVASGSTEFIVLRGNKVSPYFVYCLARTHDFRGKAIKSMIGSSGRQRVQQSCFDDIVLGLPPKQLLLQFDDVASNCFKQISNLLRQNEQLRNARDLLLPRLINGEIEV